MLWASEKTDREDAIPPSARAGGCLATAGREEGAYLNRYVADPAPPRRHWLPHPVRIPQRDRPHGRAGTAHAGGADVLVEPEDGQSRPLVNTSSRVAP
jgi:hypothetical protein